MMTSILRPGNLLVALSLMGAGCSAKVGTGATIPDGRGGGGTSGSMSGAGGTGSSGDLGGSAGGGLPALRLDSGPVVLRRLNRVEYNNTVRDLLQTTLRPADNFPPDQISSEGFDTVGEVLDLSPLHTEQYEAAAIQLVDELFALPATSPARQKVLVCALQTGSESVCARQILTGFVPRAYRRPVAPGEIDDLMALVTTINAAGNTYQDSLKAGLQAVLLSPHFLFHVENDPAPTVIDAHPVSDTELATRLSYFLWSSMPDDALFTAASTKLLKQDPAELGRQVARMLDDPKASALTDHFAAQWLTLQRLDTLAPNVTTFPNYDDALRTAAQQETGLFFQALVKDNLPLETLILADFTVANARLATHYGLPAPAGVGFSRVSLAGTPRAGVLTQASFLMSTSHPDRTSPVKRGVWVLQRLLCDPPNPPPPTLNVPALVEPPPGATLRQTLEAHRANPVCAGCHSLFDPIGLGFENFDAIGAYRTLDNGISVDAKGTLNGTPFDGPGQLAPLLAKDPRFVSCMAQQLLTYAVGRSFAAADGKRYANAVARNAVAQGKGQWRSWIETIAAAEAFQTRRGGAP
jgi:Protein of unknown function (DUF1592)/Protein of unknown function (DUF1588)/Protein of unknown function (DUF1587)/Protein of unknown function (DUF1595)/Protein of unknown function (DUF1585)